MSLTVEDGAQRYVLDALLHTGKPREVMDRYLQHTWATYCEAVSCLRLDAEDLGKVLSVVPCP